MKKYLKKFFDDFFTLSRTEQRGIIILSILTFFLILSRYFIPFLFPASPLPDHSDYLRKVEAFKAHQKKAKDSLELISLQNKGLLSDSQALIRIKPFYFDPNDLPDSLWLKMGLTQKQVKSIKNYEAKGGNFRKKSDFKKIYVISNTEYRILEPFIKIVPKSDSKNPGQTHTEANPCAVTEINAADSTDLVELGFSPWIGSRMLKYRALLGGFYGLEQLFEVYGIDSSKLGKLYKCITIDTSLIIKLNLQKDDFKKLVRHPYLSYEQVKFIMDLRSERVARDPLQGMLQSGIMDTAEHNKLLPYLE